MTLTDLIKDNPDATNLKIAAIYNGATNRYADLWLTPEALVSRVGDEIAGRIIEALEAAAQTNTVVRVAVHRLLNSERGINVGDQQTINVLRKLIAGGAMDGNIQLEDAGAVLRLLKDTHGGDVTEQDVARARALAVFTSQANAAYTQVAAEAQQTAEAAQAKRDSDIAAYRAIVAAWDGVGDAPEIE